MEKNLSTTEMTYDSEYRVVDQDKPDEEPAPAAIPGWIQSKFKGKRLCLPVARDIGGSRIYCCCEENEQCHTGLTRHFLQRYVSC